jgi:hypothetical protein
MNPRWLINYPSAIIISFPGINLNRAPIQAWTRWERVSSKSAVNHTFMGCKIVPERAILLLQIDS